MSKPFRFAVQSFNADSGQAWRDKARKVESLGYTALHLAGAREDESSFAKLGRDASNGVRGGSDRLAEDRLSRILRRLPASGNAGERGDDP
jgi:hypothetical protein